MNHIYFHLPIMVVLISLVYSATRYDDWDDILRETLQWLIKMVIFLLVIGVVLFVLAWWI